ncbi:hypothetical protein HOD30_05615 [Candidatus Peregrinibacteria bacterium]|jgi:TrpR-related protein YerC/YecD|nr:hypothetical protein [Candidatus Peregrinibacteria bacterium]MBT4631499.1 hypothetical protein [Candidatus Peregrinibacteria bacterium]MBT5516472.1 hypothetical protein [Candidatus Peregrinibacteria bacterium]MBT5823888.1 hypothetical protein [Candidatus Peregrinibacteria bacterium]
MEKQIQNNPLVNQLCEALSAVDTTEDALNLLRDLCTFSEITAMSERLEVAKQVKKGTSYRQINKNTGVSTATITRVAHWLHHGEGGYESILNHLH